MRLQTPSILLYINKDKTKQDTSADEYKTKFNKATSFFLKNMKTFILIVQKIMKRLQLLLLPSHIFSVKGCQSMHLYLQQNLE